MIKPQASSSSVEVVKEVVTKLDLDSQIAVYAIEYSVNESLARRIMSCESGLKSSALNVNYRDGIAWSKDHGYWQINDFHWETYMNERGWDIYNPDHNLEAGFWMLQTYGKEPWSASAKCHSP